MSNPLAKAWRYLRREYPDSSAAMAIGFTVGAGVATVVTLGTAAPLFIIPLAGVGAAGFGKLVTMGEWDRTSENSTSLNGCKIVGDKKDLSSLIMTQKLIDRKTRKLKHLPELPEKLRKTLLVHISDVQGALARVRVYQGYGGDQVREFSFHRDFFDARGREVEQTVATVRFEPLAPSQTPGKTEVIDAAPKKTAPEPAPVIPANNNAASAEFGQLAKKVDAVAKRVDELENPAPVVLDKPKLKPRP